VLAKAGPPRRASSGDPVYARQTVVRAPASAVGNRPVRIGGPIATTALASLQRGGAAVARLRSPGFAGSAATDRRCATVIALLGQDDEDARGVASQWWQRAKTRRLPVMLSTYGPPRV